MKLDLMYLDIHFAKNNRELLKKIVVTVEIKRERQILRLKTYKIWVFFLYYGEIRMKQTWKRRKTVLVIMGERRDQVQICGGSLTW